MSKCGAWDEMRGRITDELLHEFAIVAPPERVAESLLTKYGDVFTRTGFYASYPVPPGFWSPSCATYRRGVRRSRQWQPPLQLSDLTHSSTNRIRPSDPLTDVYEIGPPAIVADGGRQHLGTVQVLVDGGFREPGLAR